MKRLYISDLDGTLLSPKPEITPHTAEIMNALAKKGMNFTFATARSIYSAVPITSALDINVPCILMNGVSIYDIKNERYIKSEFIDPAVSAELIRIYKRHGVECFMYRIDRGALTCYYEELTSRVMQSFAEVRKQQYKKPFVQCRLEECADEYTVYFTTRGRYEELLPVKLEAEKIEGIDYAFYLDVYDDSWYLELFSHKASKSNGLRFLRDKYGFDEIVAFGDNLNDVSMIEAAGRGVVVDNGTEAAKAAADALTASCEESGVAAFFKKEYGF